MISPNALSTVPVKVKLTVSRNLILKVQSLILQPVENFEDQGSNLVLGPFKKIIKGFQETFETKCES